MNQKFCIGSLTYFDGLIFQVQFSKKQTPFTVTKKNIICTGVFTYQLHIYDCITTCANLKSRCKGVNVYLFDKDSWSLIIEEVSLDYDDRLDKLILEGYTLPYLHSGGF